MTHWLVKPLASSLTGELKRIHRHGFWMLLNCQWSLPSTQNYPWPNGKIKINSYLWSQGSIARLFCFSRFPGGIAAMKLEEHESWHCPSCSRIYFHSVCSHLSPHLTLVYPIELNYPSLFGEPNHWSSCNIIQSHSHCRTEHTIIYRIYHRQLQRLCNDSSDGHCPMYNGVCQGKHWNQWNPWANRGSYKSTQTVQNIFCRWTKLKPLLIKKFIWVHFRIQDIPKESGYLAPA